MVYQDDAEPAVVAAASVVLCVFLCCCCCWVKTIAHEAARSRRDGAARAAMARVEAASFGYHAWRRTRHRATLV